MKNKKLFAILTLVCFMFTLMPMAAFAAASYAEVNADYTTVKVNTDVKIDITNNETSFADGHTNQFFIFAEKNGALAAIKTTGHEFSNALGIVGDTVTDGTATVQFESAGTYNVYVAPVTARTLAVVNDEKMSRTAILTALKGETVTMLDNTVTVKAASSEYEIVVVDGFKIKADAGFTNKEVQVQLVYKNTKNPVVGAELKVSTNSSAITVDKETVKTNAAGIAKFNVSASVAGNYEVYVEYGSKTDATIDVTVGALTPAKIELDSQPENPIALGQGVTDAEVGFVLFDANGNAVKSNLVKETAYKVSIVSKPAGSSLAKDDLELTAPAKNDTVYTLSSDATFDEEGTYIFKVTLKNGASATATVEVKEFQKPVEMILEYPQASIEIGGTTKISKLVFVDANGTEKTCTPADVELSANGYAVKDFTAKSGGKLVGTVEAQNNDKYIGSKINVIAVSQKYNLVATADLTVASAAAGVKYVDTKADVAVNNTLNANIVDEAGNKVAATNIAEKATPEIQYVVLEKPENAKVAISTVKETLKTNGQFKVSFTASAIGDYKVQTVVRCLADSKDQEGKQVVKYYSGIETITVGNTGINDVVVMSVGSNEIVKNGAVATIDAAPMIQNSRTFVPFRALAEAFGATVAYDEATQAVTAELNGTTVVMTIGSATYTVNGVEKTADVAPFINGSRTMVPVRFVAEAFGIVVTPTYDEKGATADILFAK